MIPRLFAATGAVILWAYARACRDRNATQRRLARANLLRTVSAHPGRTDRSCDRTVTIDITPDTSKLDSLRAGWSSPDDELPPALQGVPPEEIASWAAHFGHTLTPYEQQLAARSFELRRHLTRADIEVPHTLGHLFDAATTEAVTKSLQDLVFKASPAENFEQWESYFGRKLTPWEREVFSSTGMINKRDIEIPPARTARQGGYIPGTQPVEIAPGEVTLRPDDATREAVTKALHDACGEWWREDSGDRYPGRGGW